MNNLENNKENQRNNIEKKNSNWFREKRESVKNFLEGKKDIDKIQVEEEISRDTEGLKESTIDSTLDNLNLDMQEGLELQNSDDETKDALNQFFENGEKKANDENEFQDTKDLSQNLLKNDKFKNRSLESVHQIAQSDKNVEKEIKNWKQEKNPVAKSLLRVVDWIMGTEK